MDERRKSSEKKKNNCIVNQWEADIIFDRFVPHKLSLAALRLLIPRTLFVRFVFFDHQCFLSIQPIFCEHFHSELSRRSLCEGLLADLAHFVAFCRFGHRNSRILKIDKQMRSLRSRLRLRSGFHECLRPWWYLFEGCCYMSVSGEYIYNIDIIYIYIYMSV